jgi:DNA-binding Xre family transcriptional regulator
MIIVKIREVAAKNDIKNAYQLQKLTGFSPSKAANCWKGEWQLADLNTLNTLCNLFNCTPNDILHFTPDASEETV